MSLVLRPYQVDCLDGLRQAIRGGHKHVALQSPTGSGKTEISFALIQEALAKGSRTAFIVDRLSILYQTEARLDAHAIDFGVLQSGHYRFRPYELLQLCSSQTLARRGIMDGLKLIIVDEGHTMYKSTVEFLKRHPDIVAISLSATNFTRGLGKVYSHVVNATTTDALIEQGWLVPLKPYAAKRISVDGIKTKSDGEWEDREVEKRSMDIIGDVVESWIDKTNLCFNGPVKTLVFSATVAHGKELCRQFQAAGHNFQQVSYLDGNNDSRRAMIDEFRKDDSEIGGLVSVECLAKGFDVPSVLCGVSCRPYRKSFSSHIQAIGRVMRPYSGKTFALWNDHAGNYLRFYDDMIELFANGVTSLDESDLDNKVRKEPEEREGKNACGSCGYVCSPADEVCPSCGAERPRKKNRIEHLPGELVEITGRKKAGKEWMTDKKQVQREIWGFALERKRGDRVAATKFALAQYRNVYNEWPRTEFSHVVPCEPSAPVSGFIKHSLIRFFKGKARSAA